MHKPTVNCMSLQQQSKLYDLKLWEFKVFGYLSFTNASSIIIARQPLLPENSECYVEVVGAPQSASS